MFRTSLLSLSLLMACTEAETADACFEDAHCPDAFACHEGMCVDPASIQRDSDADFGEDDGIERLDIGDSIGDASTCASARRFPTNAGCEFWAVDLPNSQHPSSPYALDVASEQAFAVVVANVSEDENARVSVHRGAESAPLDEAVVGPLGTYAFLLPNDLQTTTDTNGAGKAFRIESDLPITAYQFQPLDNVSPVYSNDASALLPSHVLANDYIAITERGILLNAYPNGFEPVASPAGAFVTVVATENGTRVTFDPTDTLAPGAWQNVMLSRGQTFTILSDPSSTSSAGGSLSGTRVRTDKPVAAFSGNLSVAVPVASDECCADHTEHQLLPTESWGTRYVLTPAPDPREPTADDPVSVRLVGAFNNTELEYPAGKPDGAPDVIHAHQEAVFSISAPVIIEAADPSRAFAVAQFLYSAGAANSGGEDGDPGMMVLPSIEQLMERYVFLTPPGYRSHAVTIIAPTDADVTVDGDAATAVGTIGWSGGVQWGYRRAAVGPGAHVVSASAAVGITVVGYDSYVSYAYVGGSAVERISDVPPAP